MSTTTTIDLVQWHCLACGTFGGGISRESGLGSAQGHADEHRHEVEAEVTKTVRETITVIPKS